jgi:hypothetical protein
MAVSVGPTISGHFAQRPCGAPRSALTNENQNVMAILGLGPQTSSMYSDNKGKTRWR